MQKISLFIFAFLMVQFVNAQRISAEEYIQQFKDAAISEMKRSGVPASIILAQGILESECGNSELVKRSNNHFGIKCKTTWTGDSVLHDDDASKECFRAYKNATDSYRDHSDFLRNNKRYANLFNIEAADYRAWAIGLKKAGYATNPVYPEMLIKNIEKYDLQQYTLAVLNDLPDGNKENAIIEKEINQPVITIDKTPGGDNHTSFENNLDDAGKVISINRLKCLLAGKGTSLLAIATRYDVNLNKLLEFNELKEDGLLSKTQYVFLQKKLKTGDKDLIIVKEGEVLYDIAQQNGIQLQYLLEYNHLKNQDKSL